ncbi:acyl-CoA dehydratase activase-related protein [Halosquirtibacter xylanolyticus]|uniref:acyl-CoA dehydratase activase-related protein n=1 Tax=Halosquirtibacter xylanolyticus TaxID=3374599 RepID=UPI003748D7AF|nr:acyl-CoA dehydratase activase-related protein [Prolixibacteraceae bacterium]
MQINKPVKMGVDMGSTTIKAVCVDDQNEIIFSSYRRHHIGIHEALVSLLAEVNESLQNPTVSLVITGSVGMGLSEDCDIPFLQEVVSASEVIKHKFPSVSTLFDMGGEDAKLIVFENNKAPIMRMNGSCAGGTGAFIDQMAVLLGVTVDELNDMAFRYKKRFPISSRCGVFAKTDIQNLLSKKVAKEDIAASIFFALANQTVTTLVRGLDLKPQMLLCGGPFSFIPFLRKALIETLRVNEEDVIVPDFSSLIPALGCALVNDVERKEIIISDLITLVEERTANINQEVSDLPPLFKNDEQFEKWKKEKQANFVQTNKFETLPSQNCFIGVDSGSTTTKIVLIDENEKLLFRYYQKNNGDPLNALHIGLKKCAEEVVKAGIDIAIKGSCVTGYGEDLIRKAYKFDFGIVETIAHYMGAMKYNPNVSFILDIGGQDMKAIFVDKGAITRLEVNEACSSGCGSFIEGFASSMNYAPSEFASLACQSNNPCDLGTRCTVFMNSKVKQSLRAKAQPGDIAAGLSYSVIKNMLFKVLKLKNVDDLGQHISVQGGTFKNLSVVKAMEDLVEKPVTFTDMPELMGALGAALYAAQNARKTTEKEQRGVAFLEHKPEYKTKDLHCKGCENLCEVQQYQFDNKEKFYSGNKCEKIFTNSGVKVEYGQNASEFRYNEVFKQADQAVSNNDAPKIGIPRVLNMFENFPFWNTFFTQLGFEVTLSDPSKMSDYEKVTSTIMSDNICFPAKLVHSHVQDLIDKKVDRLFFPYVIYEQKDSEKTTNSFNCPVVSGYSDVIKSVFGDKIEVDAPPISFKDEKLLVNALSEYIDSLGQVSVSKSEIRKAIVKANGAQHDFRQKLKDENVRIYDNAKQEDRMVVLLVGRPYHHDPLIQHTISKCITGYGVDVVTEDIVRFEDSHYDDNQEMVLQWAYVNNIIKAAHWAKRQGQKVQVIQLSSFGCGPDAFIIDELQEILKSGDKNLTLLKLDDVTNIGSLNLRVRSLIESIKLKSADDDKVNITPVEKLKSFEKEDQKRKLLLPYFSPFYSPFFPELFALAGYEVDSLPPSDKVSQELGLKYANNEVCFPATVIVGDIIKAVQSGDYDLSQVAFVMTQTGGQCRATNYLGLIKKALRSAGYLDVPLVSLTSDEVIGHEQPGFEFEMKKYTGVILNTMLFADSLAKLYYSAAPRETKKGICLELREKYIQIWKSKLTTAKTSDATELLKQASSEFASVVELNKDVPSIGVVGEIYVKYNDQNNFHVVQWMVDHGVEVVVPPVLDFMTQYFVNKKFNENNHLETKSSLWNRLFTNGVNHLLNNRIKKFNKACDAFPYFIPFTDIHQEGVEASKMVSLAAQFGEGWLIPAEYSFFAKTKVNHVVSLQPFGCIANHIISKGIENRVMKLYPDMNLLFLDLDGGVSQANMFNRLHFLVKNAKDHCLSLDREACRL